MIPCWITHKPYVFGCGAEVVKIFRQSPDEIIGDIEGMWIVVIALAKWNNKLQIFSWDKPVIECIALKSYPGVDPGTWLDG